MRIDRVRLVISGGVAGLLRQGDLDASELNAAEQSALQQHTGRTTEERAAGARDLVTYDLEIHSSAGIDRLAFDELNTPPDLADLVGRLSVRARPIAPDRA